METPNTIKLNIYDLSQGLATQLSLPILGTHIRAIYHTSITIYDTEYFFNSQGIVAHTPPLTTHFGTPIEIRDMGETYIPQEIFAEWLEGLDQFKAGKYNLWENNCNDFTSLCLEFLNDGVLDDEIKGLVHRVLQSQNGELIRQWMMGFMN